MLDEQMVELNDNCPVCGAEMMSIVSEEFSTADTLYGYDKCETCGWSGVWTIEMAEPEVWPSDQE